jgi:hypothetical protein
MNKMTNEAYGRTFQYKNKLKNGASGGKKYNNNKNALLPKPM